jgi:hypothetical protein
MVYSLKVRMEQDGIFGSFDCPRQSGHAAAQRFDHAIAGPQLFNSRFILQQAEIFATRLRREAGRIPPRKCGTRVAPALQSSAAPAESGRGRSFRPARRTAVVVPCPAQRERFLFIP